MASVTVKPFSTSIPEVLLYTLTRGKLKATISSLGATVTRLLLPDAAGKVDDVVLGFDELEPYMNGTSPYFGCVVGRVANRIGGATFTLDGKQYKLPANDGENTLHGGKAGFDKKIWQSEKLDSEDGPAVRFTLHSPDGDQGFPGDLDVAVTYTLTSDTEMRTVMEARSISTATPVSLAHHAYWNLRGHSSGSVDNHRLRIWASNYTPVDDKLIPTGNLVSVKNTPFDFSEEATIGSRLSEVPGGYDHNYVLDGVSPETTNDQSSLDPSLRLAAQVKEPQTGRVMTLLTNVPGMQFYSGNFLDGSFKGKEGSLYGKHSAFCLETQGFPNAVNEPKFPSVIIRPGEVYRHIMVHRFSTYVQ